MVSDAFHTSSQRAMCKCFLSLPTNNWLNGFCKSKAVWSISGPLPWWEVLVNGNANAFLKLLQKVLFLPCTKASSPPKKTVGASVSATSLCKHKFFTEVNGGESFSLPYSISLAKSLTGGLVVVFLWKKECVVFVLIFQGIILGA